MSTINLTEVLWVAVCLSGLPLPAWVALRATRSATQLRYALATAGEDAAVAYTLRIAGLTVLRSLCLGVIGLLAIFICAGLFAMTVPAPSSTRTTPVGWAIVAALFAGVLVLNLLVAVAAWRDWQADEHLTDYLATQDSPSDTEGARS